MHRGFWLFRYFLLAVLLLATAVQAADDRPDRRAGPPGLTTFDRDPLLGSASTGPTSGDVVNVKDFGAVGNGVTDDTAAIQAALDSLVATGGAVFFPVGTYRVNGQLAMPNNGAPAEIRQPSYVLTGAGALFDGRGGGPIGGTVLDLRYDLGPKFVTYGLGLLEVSGITFADLGSDSQPFLYTTNTTLHIHNCAFFGTKFDVSADNDAIILGGTDASLVGTSDPNAPFQGYGTVIRDNYFSRIRRAVYGRVFANAVIFSSNTIWNTCGSNLPNGSAIELDGDPDQTTQQKNGGWYIAGNLIEMPHYVYGIKCTESTRNAFIANNFFDAGDATMAYYKLENSASQNYVLAGFHDDTKIFVQDRASGLSRSTVIDFHTAKESLFSQKGRFLNELYLEPFPSAADPYGPRLVNENRAELTYRFIDESGIRIEYALFDGNSVNLWQVKDFGGGVVIQDVQGTDARIRNDLGSLKLHSKVDEFVEVGDRTGLGIRVDSGDIQFTETAVRLMSGPGVPTIPAPNGSIFMRTDGGPGSTFYVREGGAWVAK